MLSITAYKNLKVVENPVSVFDEEGYLENEVENEWIPEMEETEKEFPNIGEGIDANTVYTWEKKYDFCAGSYFAYSWWRDKLSKLSDGISFKELINFVDSAGVIGFVVAKKLYKDFADNKERAEGFSKTFEDGEIWLQNYNNWMIAFEFASENGAVSFC